MSAPNDSPLEMTDRWGDALVITAKCDDFPDAPWVHVRFTEDGKEETCIISELRAPGGWAVISDTINAAPLAGCTGKHRKRDRQ